MAKLAPGNSDEPLNRKQEAILRAALSLFLEHGYGATSMDAVSLTSGVSKATLYVYYKSKKELFAQIVTRFSLRYSSTLVEQQATDEDVRVTLVRMGRSILALLLAGDAVAAHRMVVAEAVRSPDLGQLYYETGPARLLGYLEGIIHSAMSRGQLRTAPARQAAEQFIGLVRGNLFSSPSFAAGWTSSTAHIDRIPNRECRRNTDAECRELPTRPRRHFTHRALSA